MGKPWNWSNQLLLFDTDEKKWRQKALGRPLKLLNSDQCKEKNELLSHSPLYTTFQWLKKTWLIIRAVGLHFKCEPSSLLNVLYGVLFFS